MDDEGDDDGDLNDDNSRQNDQDDKDEPPSKRNKLKKNPNVDTSFLPDREREEAERKERERLRLEWLAKQEEKKKEDIEVVYSYWDGSGHRKSVTCKKGDDIGSFLEKCRQQFPELRGVSVDNLMYVKEDIIIPHHYTFYDFIVNKARGKSGPLFNFDVHDDVRLLADATKEKDESHAGKVVERSYYQRNKHIFPASRWEVGPECIEKFCKTLTCHLDFRFSIQRRTMESTQSPEKIFIILEWIVVYLTQQMMFICYIVSQFFCIAWTRKKEYKTKMCTVKFPDRTSDENKFFKLYAVK